MFFHDACEEEVVIPEAYCSDNDPDCGMNLCDNKGECLTCVCLRV
jgi:hypothetical protein